MSVRSLLHTVRDGVRTQLWPLPILGVVIALVLGVLIPHLDTQVDAHLPGWIDPFVFGGDAGAARTVLEAVAGSLITVTSLTFSLTVVTLQLASSQFSPRLLRTFTQDLFVQVTLAIFLATFTYSLTVLRSVRSSDGSVSAVIPRLAVTTSFVLAVASVVGLVLFLAHLTRQIRVETMLRSVHEVASETIESNLVSRDEADSAPVLAEKPAAQRQTLWAWESGFYLRVDQNELIGAAEKAGLVVRIDRHPGDFVVEGTPLGSTWAAPDNPESDSPVSGKSVVSKDAQKTFDRAVRRAVHFGAERTAVQDVGYGLRQLIDVTNKALSPGINDPTTAVHALGHTACLLSELTNYELGPRILADDEDVVRVVIGRPDFADYLDVAMTQPRSYGKSDSQVLMCLYELLRDVAWHAHRVHRAPIELQLDRLRLTAHGSDFDPTQLSQLDAAERSVREALAGPRAER